MARYRLRRALGEVNGMIVDPKTVTRNITDRADVVIIGSGAAGAALAMEFAEAGRTVILLEEGPYATKADFNQREDRMYPLLYRGRGGQATKDLSVSVLQGRCVGGSTVVNAADVVRPDDRLLAMWERTHHVTGRRWADLAPFVDKAEHVIQANRIEEGLLNAGNRLLKKGADTLGFRGETFIHNRKGCVGCGYCFLGCAYDAKQSALITYIPRALKGGAKLYHGARAERITVKNRRVEAVEGSILDPASGRPSRRFTMTGAVVFLSASSIASPQILLNSRIANSSGQVGRNLTLQPQTPMAALFPEDVVSYRGIIQAYAVEEFHTVDPVHGEWGFRLEGIGGGPAMSATMLGSFGALHKDLMRNFNRVAAALLLVPDTPSGRVTVDGRGRPVISYTISEPVRTRLREGMRRAAEIYLEAGASAVNLPFEELAPIRSKKDLRVIDRLPIEANRLSLLSAHPQGTCRMGEDPKTSVVNSMGECHDVKNLFVCDASVFPTSASTHTMLTIQAFALQTADYVLKNPDKYF